MKSKKQSIIIIALSITLLFLIINILTEKKLFLSEKTVSNQAQNDNMEASADVFLNLFRKSYPEAYITKIRWQYVPDDKITYIIDGIEDNMKYTIKYLDSSGTGTSEDNVSILGKVERDLNDHELSEGNPVEKPLKPQEYLSETKIISIAENECDSPLQEWKVIWVDSKEYLQLILWGEDFKRTYIILDPRTGELIQKY